MKPGDVLRGNSLSQFYIDPSERDHLRAQADKQMALQIMYQQWKRATSLPCPYKQPLARPLQAFEPYQPGQLIPILSALFMVLLLTTVSVEAGEPMCAIAPGGKITKEIPCAELYKHIEMQREWTTEHPSGHVERCRVWSDGDLGLQVECKVTPKEFTCYQRMQTVMKKMDRLLNMPVRDNKDFETLPMKEWNRVVKDCIAMK